MFTPSTLRHRLRAVWAESKTAYGTFMMLPSSRTAQVVAQADLDAVIIDCEHGNIDDRDMHDAVFAVAANNVSPIVRIRGTDAALIKRALDAGAHGLMVPMINTAEEARYVVSASKFPPVGVRGQGSPFTASAFGITTPEYIQCANDNLLTIVQIETRQAVENIEDIVRVSGIDMVFIGPNDLALSILGHTPARQEDSEFHQAVDTIIAAARKSGVRVGTLVSTGEQAKEAAKRFDLIAIGGDVKAITWWFEAQLSHVR